MSRSPKKIPLLALSCLLSASCTLQAGAQPAGQLKTDWLLDASPFVARVRERRATDEVLLTNGLISRLFRLSPNCATVDYRNLMTGETILRAVRPEAVLTLVGRTGGLKGQVE